MVWGDAQERAYCSLKTTVMSQPILHLLDHRKQFVLRSDASEIGIGAILMQYQDGKLFPVTYISKKLTHRERNFFTIQTGVFSCCVEC